LRPVSIEHPEAADSPRDSIRRAALLEFGEKGFVGASIRSVAARAGVSPGLVQHYFRSKQSLRRAVTDLVLETLQPRVARLSFGRNPASPFEDVSQALVELTLDSPDIIRYGRQLLAEGGDEFNELISRMAAVVEAVVRGRGEAGMVRADVDLEWAAIQILLLAVGPLLIQGGVERYLGRPLVSEAELRRWHEANEALVSEGIFRDRRR
jgi:TetR/AcrR family transcriptional regulator, regulator of cefoperazone and chloramphenicol sensitivity